VEELPPLAYITIISVSVEGVCLQGCGSETTPTPVPVRDSLTFQALLKETFQSSTAQQAVVQALTYKESNALWYVAGYVCHKL